MVSGRDLPRELRKEVIPREQIKALQPGRVSISGWYVADIVLCEVHDKGSHGASLLIWINSYLIEASGSEEAYSKAMHIGKSHEGEDGSHTCDGESAHWRFEGFRDIIPLHNAPADGVLLWCDEAKPEAGANIVVPPKSELGVFKWRTEQQRDPRRA